MARRRPLRRSPGRPGAAPARDAALKALRQATRFVEAGEYARAYPILKRLADVAARRGMPRRAGYLYLQAARARLEMGEPRDALVLAQHAIQHLAGVGRVERASRLLLGTIQALEDKGYREQAVTLRAQVSALLGGSGLAPSVLRQSTLPTRCPSCNAPVRPDQVSWIDGRSVECVFCGGVVRATDSATDG